ncbi:coiled-coil domain-containing protein 97-like isoform X2 [Panicum virgatum]|uniref:coiled-coil domain-containing protein 97-like isoform X2 n=1 Tax=Panicum virgatum TaxID=38727 RepID=UPI0019D51158|nr:coiled-coil domain-containing protein 97-like isoform X2 [Panicum virgatum]
MEPAAMDRIATRLSAVEGLYFPSSFLSSSPAAGPPSSPRRRAELRALLARDAPLFLERYGSALSAGELAAFDALSPDYEVDWHLRRLRAAAAGAPPPAARVRNRRRAYLDRLVREGDYFSEEAMREREPYLHHEYLGRFQDPLGRAMARPGERWSETLMRRAEEAVIVEKIRGEQIRRGVDPREWVGGGPEEAMEEQEEEEEEEEEEKEEEISEEKGSEVDKPIATEEMIFSPLCNCRWLQTGLPLWTPAMGEVLLQGLSSKRYLLKKCRISWSSSHI